MNEHNNELDEGVEKLPLPDEELEIIFKKVIKVGGVEYLSITLEEPTATQLEKANTYSNQMGVVIQLISLVSKTPRKVIEQMKQSDLVRAANFLGTFNGGNPLI
jgi:Phage tail assembly chaperone proteins, E, or 41 or 14